MEYTFYWRDGKRDVLEGYDPANALNRAGYGAGALAALDFHAKGDNKGYEFVNGKWQVKEQWCEG